MAKRRGPEKNLASRRPEASAPPVKPTHSPRVWRITALALVLAPLLIVGTLDSWEQREVPTSVPDALRLAARAQTGESPPWGTLVTTPVVISPPYEYVPRTWHQIAPVEWHLPGVAPVQLPGLLTRAGLTPDQIEQLRGVTRLSPAIDGLVVQPAPALVRSLSSDVRGRLYLELGRSPLNDHQRNSFRYSGPSIDDWFRDAPIAPSTLQLVEPLIYRHDNFLYFADIDLIRPRITDPDELQRLTKVLYRQSTLLVNLDIGDASQIDRVIDYWGRGGRRTDIRPLLESVSAGEVGERTVDISHLLPTFARSHLYRYPKISLADLEQPSLVNCFWTALNFFNARPDDRFLDYRVAVDHLRRDYSIVQGPLEFGDIVAFADATGYYFHAVVYIADDLVFGKNGTSHLAPWTIQPFDHVKGYYINQADDWRISYYRRKDL